MTDRRSVLLPIALGIVWVVWGSTYLGIAVAIETLPPFTMAALRFLVAGGALAAWSWRRGTHAADPVGPRQWRNALLVAFLMLVCGNGAVVLGEQSMPSGTAALLVATVPLWLALFARLRDAERLAPQAVAGLALGFAGVALLVRPATGTGVPIGPALLVLSGAACWALGTLVARRAALPARALVSASLQMLCAGAMFTVVAAVTGELGRVDVGAISGRSLAALAYLIVFGSLLAFTAYSWLLRNAATGLVGTYAYVNPVVAVTLGWAVLGEPITSPTLVAGAVVVAAVVLIVTAGRRAASATAGPARRGATATCRVVPVGAESASR